MYGQILRVLEVLHISCNTGTLALLDLSTLAIKCHVYISGNIIVPVLQLLHHRYGHCYRD